jgi:hypothetical protein
MQREHDRTQQQRDYGHPDKLRTVLGEEIRRRGSRPRQVDELAEIGEQRQFDDAAEKSRDKHADKGRPGLPDVMPEKLGPNRRRLLQRRRTKGVNKGFEPTKHGVALAAYELKGWRSVARTERSRGVRY